MTPDPVVKESLTVDTAYREGFEAGARAMRAKCAWKLELIPGIAEVIQALPLPTPTTKG